MHPEPSDYAAFEHTIARDCRGGRRARRSARAPSISKARLRSGGVCGS